MTDYRLHRNPSVPAWEIVAIEDDGTELNLEVIATFREDSVHSDGLPKLLVKLLNKDK